MISFSRLFRRIYGNYPHSKRVYIFLDDAEKQPFIFEMTGSPGIGKSTLLYNMLDAKLIRKADYKGLNSDRFHDDEKIRIAYDALIKKTLENLKNIEDIEKYSRRAAGSLALQMQVRSDEKSGTLIVEEGLFHHFMHQLIGIYSSDKPLFDFMMEGRAIVHLTARPGVIAERVIKRYKETGKLLPCHANKNFCQIRDYCQASQARREHTLKQLESMGIPVLSISAENSSAEMASQITAFIHKTLSS